MSSSGTAIRSHHRFHDLGLDYHTTRINTDRKIRNLVHQLEALGHTVTLQPAA
jgi:transposase